MKSFNVYVLSLYTHVEIRSNENIEFTLFITFSLFAYHSFQQFLYMQNIIHRSIRYQKI